MAEKTILKWQSLAEETPRGYSAMFLPVSSGATSAQGEVDRLIEVSSGMSRDYVPPEAAVSEVNSTSSSDHSLSHPGKWPSPKFPAHHNEGSSTRVTIDLSRRGTLSMEGMCDGTSALIPAGHVLVDGLLVILPHWRADRTW